MNDENLLAGLPREERPDPDLEERIVGRLHARGLLTARPRRAMFAMAIAAALCIGFIGGLLLPPRDTPAPQGRSFVLLLYRGAEKPLPAAESARRVDEYRRWAQQLRSRDRLLGGEKLRSASTTLGPATSSEPVAGYFIIAAEDEVDAVRVARECPHLRYGGWIEVREIEKT